MHPYLTTATKAARSAGKLIARSIDHLEQIKVTEKQQNDFVTEVDQQSERIIIDCIRTSHPEHAILAEESGAHEGNDVTWIIDPLDGTRNFLHGIPHLCISIAVKQKSQLEAAVIYDPLRDELFTAARGKGAFMNNRRLRVSDRILLENALIGTGFPFRDKNLIDDYLHGFKNLFSQCAGVRRAGSAALDLAYVAAGRLDGFWEFGLQPWDIAAGCLLIREAGGMVCDLAGGEQYLQTGNIVGGNIKLLKSILKNINVAHS